MKAVCLTSEKISIHEKTLGRSRVGLLDPWNVETTNTVCDVFMVDDIAFLSTNSNVPVCQKCK